MKSSPPTMHWLLMSLIACFVAPTKATLVPIVRPAQIEELIQSSVNATSELILEYDVPRKERSALRLFVQANPEDVTSMNPLTVVVKHDHGVLSWQIPLEIHADLDADGKQQDVTKYYSVNRTLCPDVTSQDVSSFEKVFVTFSTSSPVPVLFQSSLYRQSNFSVINDTSYFGTVSPSAPVFFHFKQPEDMDVALLKFNSEDEICMTLSVQNVSCPVFDLDRNVAFEGLYQTVDTKTGVTFTRKEFPLGVFIVLVVKADDVACHSRPKPTVLLQSCGGSPCRTKSFEFRIEAKITKSEYLAATFGAVSMFVGAYLFVLMVSCVLCIRKIRLPLNDQDPITSSIEDQVSAITTLENEDPDAIQSEPVAGPSGIQGQGARDDVSTDSSLDETEIDLLEDADFEKDVFRTKTFLYVSDLSRKPPKVLAKKSQLYHWNLLTIAIFYGLPVIQLMLTYQNVTNTTGNQDLCYYNYLCAHPLGILSDFNHVFSNLGYVLLGLLFMAIVWRKDLMYQGFVKDHPGYDRKYGIPQHFGMYYAMGLALIMEGILSGCYHVCPSHDNFQFDTAFMYTIAILILLKIYQNRHPDINANAYTAFGALAFIIFVGVIGVLHGNLYFWMFFTSLHVVSCLVLSIQVYYMGRWKLDLGIFKRMWLVCYNDSRSLCSGDWRALRPMYPDRLMLLLILNLVNWGLSAYGVTTLAQHGGDFASFLLAIMISNVMLYTSFYILMKLRHKERITWQPAIYSLLSFLSMGSAMYFFLNKSTTWVLTPAQSRHFNQDCKLFHFYDNHDIWHFLSATSLFLSFMVLFTLDDDLDNVSRDKIPVF